VLIDDSLSSARIADLGNAGKMVQFLVTATEVPGGNHAPEWWRQRLAYGIATLAAAWH